MTFLPKWCSACNSDGRDCQGGNNRGCVKRVSVPSRIGGIIDSYGGVRVVVTQKKDFHNHLRCGEFLVVVPKIMIHEPVSYDQTPWVVRHAELAVERWVKDNEHTNDQEKQEAIRGYKFRRLRHPAMTRNLDLLSICYT